MFRDVDMYFIYSVQIAKYLTLAAFAYANEDR